MRHRIFFCVIGSLMIFHIGCAAPHFGSSPLARIQRKPLQEVAEESARISLNGNFSSTVAGSGEQEVFAEEWAYVDPEFQSPPPFEDAAANQLAATGPTGDSHESWKPIRRWASSKSR